MSQKDRKRIKAKQRAEKLKKQKLHKKAHQHDDHSPEAKKRGLIQIYVVIAIAVLGSAIIIYNFT